METGDTYSKSRQERPSIFKKTFLYDDRAYTENLDTDQNSRSLESNGILSLQRRQLGKATRKRAQAGNPRIVAGAGSFVEVWAQARA